MRYYKSRFDSDTYQIIDRVTDQEICVVGSFEGQKESIDKRANRILSALNTADMAAKPKMFPCDDGNYPVPEFVGLYVEAESNVEDCTISMLDEPMSDGSNPALVGHTLAEVQTKIKRLKKRLSNTGPILVARVVWMERIPKSK